jgi:hypothetical protein
MGDDDGSRDEEPESDALGSVWLSARERLKTGPLRFDRDGIPMIVEAGRTLSPLSPISSVTGPLPPC